MEKRCGSSSKSHPLAYIIQVKQIIQNFESAPTAVMKIVRFRLRNRLLSIANNMQEASLSFLSRGRDRYYLTTTDRIMELIFMDYKVNKSASNFHKFSHHMRQRSGDIITCATRMLQFWSEMQQTWQIYYPRPQEQLRLRRFSWPL
jgi:hypothetical protein